jgi:hypothetical protein
MTERFRDPGVFVELLWVRPILVRCPSCGGAAFVGPAPGEERPLYFRDSRARLTCPSCVHVDDAPPRRSYRVGVPRDPFFGAELLLQDECAGHVLWAFNEPHLDLIASYVAADLRERARFSDQPRSMLEKLPAWIKDARHRDEIARSIQRLRTLIPS